MIFIDNNLNQVESDKNKEVEEVLANVVSYLNNVVTDENIKQTINENAQNIIIQYTDGLNYSIKLPNGSTRTTKFPGSAGAFKANMYNEVNEKEFHIIPGIALRPNFDNHKLTHELLHALSSNQHNYLNEDGIFYTKTGTDIDFYDKDTNDYNVQFNPSSEGLNEGITELLASTIIDKFDGTYAEQVQISKLLMNANPNLLNAYFSRNFDEIEKFYSDLEEKQSIITRDDLIKLSSKENSLEDISKVINGAVAYNRANNPNFGEDNISEIISYLDSNSMLDSGSWSDLISYENSKNR